jgi:hypothetical protein
MTKARDLANASTALSAVTATELGYVDGVTSAIQTQIDTKLASSTAATTYQAINANVSTTELGYLDGVTSAIQTQINAQIPKSIVTAKGDLIVATGSGTVVAQAVGSNGQVLTANSAQADGVEWATPAVSGGMTLISTTSLTGTTVTLNSFSGYTDLQLVIIGAYGSNQNTFRARFNSDTGANYYEGQYANGANAGAATSLIMGDGTSSSSTNVNQRNFSVLKIQRYAQTHGKPFQVQSGYIYWSSNATNYVTTSNSIYAGTSAITSIDLYMASGSFSGGTAYLYGVK